MKCCPRCKQTKPYSEFPRNRTRTNGRASFCRQCKAAYDHTQRRQYRAFWQTNDPYKNQNKKRCPKCKIYKDRKEFHLNRNFSDGLYGYCVPCTAGQQRTRRYGISEEEYQKKLREQKHKCALCFEPLGESPHTDHCHKRGGVRGIIHRQCNAALGFLRDDPQRALMAYKYLMKFQKNGRRTKRI